MIAAIKVRGSIDARKKVKNTLQTLGLEKKNQCVVLDDTESARGMLDVVKDYVTYGEIDDETVEELEDRHGRELEHGDVVNLPPPSGGYSDTKKNVNQGGSLGEREDLDRLVQKMA
ncbi:MAG: uL30 family ribosomal protein [Candidatus Nanohaloarchaea archaeon]